MLKVLWVKAGKLLPVDSGGKIRSYNLLKQLLRIHQVTLLSYYGGQRDLAYEEAIRGELAGAHTIHTAALDGNFAAQTWDYLCRFSQPAPFAVSKFTDHEVRKTVAAWLNERRFDVAVCDFLSASLNFPFHLPLPTVLFQHNVESALWRRMAATESNLVRRIAYKIEAAKMNRYEKAALSRFHHIIAVSDHDREQMLHMDPSCEITVVPTGVDTQKYLPAPPSQADPPIIIFTGSMDWEPNIDAVDYFCEEIFPRVHGQFPRAIFQIVGRHPHPRVKRLASASVHVSGTVPSVSDYLSASTIVVVPLRIGGGTRLKIFEAMAMGKAVVSTSIGAEGLEVENGRDLILADDASSFAEAILLLLRDTGLRRSYEAAAVAQARQYDWARIVERFSSVLEAATRSGQTQTAPGKGGPLKR